MFLFFSSSSAEPDHELFLVYGKGRPGIIRGMDMNAKVPDEYMIPIENLMNPRALDFHAASEFIYFADATSYIIGRQKIDGTERDTILKEGESEMMSLVEFSGLFFSSLSQPNPDCCQKIYAKDSVMLFHMLFTLFSLHWFQIGHLIFTSHFGFCCISQVFTRLRGLQ